MIRSAHASLGVLSRHWPLDREAMDTKLKPPKLDRRAHEVKRAPHFQPLRLFLNGNNPHACASRKIQYQFSRTILALPAEDSAAESCQGTNKQCPVLRAVQHLGRLQMEECDLSPGQELDGFSWLTDFCGSTIFDDLQPRIADCTVFAAELENSYSSKWILDGKDTVMESAKLLETPLPFSMTKENLSLLVGNDLL